ncbi:3-oxoadipate enol-lactonase [Stenotrophomonas sp. ZAC14D2_NAIMI4_6]|uniref:3-oxoadipate enol-lactonase n=1 Tax=Stenotrophomonas sp. ZAC14D2_NAIMI4_6 TaxID=2072406 RepID=UPI000D53C52B|nr:3-oxoadipate enol-lactonase [Stenotrophomonas sp. ZAC14D2_NAIMI4_6]AWH21206.1 3-oxoadipate enol-lactonase [Stenotrophomonas sp. ZAC14D2_NAIMI4_6]
MPFLELPQHRLHFQTEGREDGPWLTFCNSLGTDLGMWAPQAQALSAQYRILRYDRRGHGQSSAPPGLYSVVELGADVLALWDHLGIERSHFCGLSIGGLTGQWLGVHAGNRLRTLTVAATAAKIGSDESWQARIAQVQHDGLLPLVDGTRERWFTAGFAQTHASQVEDILQRFLATSVEGYVGCCNAVGTADFREVLARIQVPLLAIAGDDDPVCVPADLQAIASGAAQGAYAQVAGRHICNLESPQAFTAALAAHLAQATH